MRNYLSAFLLMFAAIAPARAAKAPHAKAPPVLAVEGIEGRVMVLPSGTADWTQAKLHQLLPVGTKVRTEADSSAILAFSDGTKLKLSPLSNFAFDEAIPGRTTLFLGVGRLYAWVKKQHGGVLQVRTPTAVAAVRGTELMLEVVNGVTFLKVTGGSVMIALPGGGTRLVRSGETVQVSEIAISVVTPSNSGGNKDAQNVLVAKKEGEPDVQIPSNGTSVTVEEGATISVQQQQTNSQLNPKQGQDTVSPTTP